MWLRASHFVRAWTKFLSRVQTDNWAEQAKAERGSGNSHLVPLVVLAVSFVVLGWSLVPAAGADPVLRSCGSAGPCCTWSPSPRRS